MTLTQFGWTTREQETVCWEQNFASGVELGGRQCSLGLAFGFSLSRGMFITDRLPASPGE